MLVGKCPRCGYRRIGWALHNPRHQTCPQCGTGLEITDGKGGVYPGYSPFDAENTIITPPDRTAPSQQGEEKQD